MLEMSLGGDGGPGSSPSRSRPHLPTHTGAGVLTSPEEPSAPPQGVPIPGPSQQKIGPRWALGAAGAAGEVGQEPRRCCRCRPTVGSCTCGCWPVCSRVRVRVRVRVCACLQASMCAHGVQQGLSKPGQPRSAAHRAAPWLHGPPDPHHRSQPRPGSCQMLLALVGPFSDPLPPCPRTTDSARLGLLPHGPLP